MKLKSGNWKVLSWSNSLWMSLQFHRFWARGLRAPTALAFLSRLNWKSKLMSDHRQSNQANSVFCVWRTGPCGYRTLISQTPLVGLPALPICSKLHASFSELLNIGRHSSPLNIPPLFASLKSGFWTNDLLFIHEKTARQLTQRWKVSSNCVNKNILTHTGHLCSNWKLLQFNTSRISCPISLHSQGQYRDETADPKTVLWNHLPVIHTCSPPSTFTPQNVKPTSRAACKNTVGTGHWPLYRK